MCDLTVTDRLNHVCTFLYVLPTTESDENTYRNFVLSFIVMVDQYGLEFWRDANTHWFQTLIS